MIFGEVAMNYSYCSCGNDTAEIEYLASIVNEWSRKTNNLTAISLFRSAEAFLYDYAENKNYDILLLDIEMERISGVELARYIRAQNREIQIVFVTGYRDYILEGYEVEALHYLIKPVSACKLSDVLDRAVLKLRRNEHALLFNIEGESVRIPLYEIRYIEVCRNYTTVHANGEYTVKSTLKEMEAELDESFFRTGRSFIVNLRVIRKMTRQDVILTDGTRIPLSRGYYDALNRAVIERL